MYVVVEQMVVWVCRYLREFSARVVYVSCCSSTKYVVPQPSNDNNLLALFIYYFLVVVNKLIYVFLEKYIKVLFAHQFCYSFTLLKWTISNGKGRRWSMWSLLECVTHSTSTECCGGDLHAYLTHTIDLRWPADGKELYSTQSQFTDRGGLEGLVNLGGKPN